MQRYINFASELAQISGEVIQHYHQNKVQVDIKPDGSPVTIADREAEKVMREMILKAFPEHGIIGEEFKDYQPDADYQWVIDPIDGTTNFLTGSFLFGTLIALMHNGNPILGIIHHPLTGQLLVGVEGETRLNGQTVRVRPCRSVDAATICSSVHSEVAQHRDFEAYQKLIHRGLVYRTWGDCHGYYLLATGGADVMLDPIMKIWDIVALIPIIEGAGGKITDWEGKSALSGNGIIASAGDIHHEVVQALNPHLVNRR